MNNYDHGETSFNASAREHQALADPAYRTHGMEAPQRVYGEAIDSYRKRLLRPLVRHSERWKSLSVDTVNESALPVVERQVFADAVTAGTHNTGPLREVTEVDQSGRKIHRFFRDTSNCWDMFKGPVRHVVGWNTKP